MNTEYIKDYKFKELKQFVLAYLLITVASVGFYTEANVETEGLVSSLFSMVTIDILVGGICALVFVLNELWSDKAKTRIVYHEMPSDSVFSDISAGRIDATGFDLIKAQNMYTHLADANPNRQTAEWNLLLKKSRDAGQGNVIEAERMQLMTRDICISTISLLIMTVIALIVLIIASESIWNPLKMFGFSALYLAVMFFITRSAARSRAARFVSLVVKNDVQSSSDA